MYIDAFWVGLVAGGGGVFAVFMLLALIFSARKKT